MVTTQTFPITGSDTHIHQSMSKADEEIFWKETIQVQGNSCNNMMVLEEHNKDTDSVK